MSRSHHYFTSESVSEGHPDKIADQVSDLILDRALEQDRQARVACECLVKTGMVLVAGEMTTQGWIDIEKNVRQLLHDIGYNHPSLGFDADSCAVLNAIGQQSPDIAQGVEHTNPEDQGAGDQGLVFGYACRETEVYMPAPITYAHRLMRRQAKVRKQGQLPWLGPDAKSQVTIRYEAHQPVGVDSIVLSTQHSDSISNEVLEEAVMDEIIKPVIPEEWIDRQTKFYINPTGRFVLGGPQADCGLTGRKIIVDTYGGKARHGGGAYSGKDPSKVDRSASYAARYAAKNMVAAGLAEECEIQISYAIGVAEPTSISVDSYGTGVIDDEKLEELARNVFDFRPYGIVRMLDLLEPFYRITSAYGHFGRADQDLPWERLDKVDEIRDYAGIST